MPESSASMERGSGVALWRQIADRIRHGIAGGEFAEGGKLPPEMELAARFGVNRHTVRSAIAALVQEGALWAEQGRGTFVREARRVSYPIGRRTRFSANLEGQTRESGIRLVASATVPADPAVARALNLPHASSVLRLDTISTADGRPIARATHWFDADRFSGLADAFAASGSITSALAACGVEDYLRRSTTVSARHADASLLGDLALSPGAILLVSRSVNEDMDGQPIQYSETLFAADRVELQIVGER